MANKKKIKMSFALGGILIVLLAMAMTTSPVFAAQSASATRDIETQSLAPGEYTDITVTITNDVEQPLSLDEDIPAGWTLTTVSDDADFYKSSTNEWLWFIFEVGTKTVVYSLTVSGSATAGDYSITGAIMNDSGVIDTIKGEDTITVTGVAPPEIVINEFVSDNATEWVELYNNGSSSVDLTGWALEDEVGNSKPLSGTIGVYGYIVLTSSGWLNNGGDIIWLNSTTENVDRVGYGTSGGAPAPGAGNSTGRYPNGVDTDNDAADFREFGTPTPGTANEIPDITPPVISTVASSGITYNSATITWATDEISDSVVKYGTTSGAYTMQADDATDVLAHSIGLSGLAAETTYYFVVNSTDPSDNSAESSEEYNFTTLAAPFVETIIVLPSMASLQVGATQQFAATAYDQYNEVMTGVTFTWESSNTGVGTIDTDGLFTAVGAGAATVQATADSVTGTADVSVAEAPTPAPIIRRGGGGGAPRDTDGDGYTDFQELLTGTNERDPCDPNLESAACLAIRPPVVAPAPTPTAPAPTPTARLAVPTPAATPAAPTPAATEEPGGIFQAIPGFEAIFVVAGVLAVAFLLLRRKRK